MVGLQPNIFCLDTCLFYSTYAGPIWNLFWVCVCSIFSFFFFTLYSPFLFSLSLSFSFLWCGLVCCIWQTCDWLWFYGTDRSWCSNAVAHALKLNSPQPDEWKIVNYYFKPEKLIFLLIVLKMKTRRNWPMYMVPPYSKEQ